MDFIRSTSEKMNLWPVEHFFPPFFSRSVLIGGKFIFTKKSITRFAFQCNFNQSALIWKKTGEKSVQLVRGSFFQEYFLWNPYFREKTLPCPQITTVRCKVQVKKFTKYKSWDLQSLVVIVLSCPLIGSLSSSIANQRAAQEPDFGVPGFVFLKLCYM